MPKVTQSFTLTRRIVSRKTGWETIEEDQEIREKKKRNGRITRNIYISKGMDVRGQTYHLNVDIIGIVGVHTTADVLWLRRKRGAISSGGAEVRDKRLR